MSVIPTSIMSSNDKMLWEKIINQNNEEKQEVGWDGDEFVEEFYSWTMDARGIAAVWISTGNVKVD